MRIRSVAAIPVGVPRAKPMIAAGIDAPIAISYFGIVRVTTDEGIDGLGEIWMNGNRNGAMQCREVNEVFASSLIGEDPFCVRAILLKLNQLVEGSEAAKAGIEMALLDVIGKALGVPIYTLLGGKVRDAVPVAWVIGFGPPASGADEAATYVARGFRTIKLKVGRPGRDADIQMVAAVRAAVGDSINIRVDANCAYSSPLEAVQEIRAMEAFDLQLVEQPLRPRPLEGMAFVRSRIHTPLLADESMWVWTDAYEVARSGAADVLNIEMAEAGGILAACNAFAIGEAAGLPAVIGSQCELGIGTAAMAHLAVCMTNLAYESDITGHLRYSVDIINESLSYKDGQIRPPDRPGLGVTLNEQLLNKWRLDA